MTFLQGRQLVGNPNTSREEMLYNLRRAETQGLTNEADSNELKRRSVGGLSNWVTNEALRIQNDSETPMSPADAIAAATQSQGYIRAINQQLGGNPSYMKYVAGHENRDMSAFDSNNPYKGFKFYDPKQVAHIVDSEGNPKYPNGAVNMEMNLRENTTTENVMNGLADWLPDGAREYIPGTRAVPLTKNATSAPDDPLDLISVEDAERLTSMRDTASRVNDLQALSGNASTDTAAMRYMQRFGRGKDGPNPYAPGLAYALQQNAYVNTGVYDSQRQKEFENVVQQPLEKKADAIAAHNKALATMTPAKPNTTVLEAQAEQFSVAEKFKKLPRFAQATKKLAELKAKMAATPAGATRDLLETRLSSLKEAEEEGLRQYLEGMFDTGVTEFYDKTKGETGFIDTTSALFDWGQKHEPGAGNLADQFSIDGDEVSLINATGEKGDPRALSDFAPMVQKWFTDNVKNIEKKKEESAVTASSRKKRRSADQKRAAELTEAIAANKAGN